MTRRTALASAAVTLLLVASAGRPAEATAPAIARARPWRLLAGALLVGPALATTYETRYAPPFEFVEHTGTASQAMPLDASTAPGLQLGLERAIGTHVGIELLAERSNADVTGAPGRYQSNLSYTSRPPPSNEPVAVRLQRSEARPAAAGELKTWCVALNLRAWLDLGARARLGLSAGPAWLKNTGWAQTLVYTNYWLGGHSVPFSEDHLVSFDYATSGLAADVGAFADVDLGGPVGLRLDARYYWGAEREVDVTLRDVVNADSALRTLLLEQIEAGLAPAPVRVDPSLFRAALALSVSF